MHSSTNERVVAAIMPEGSEFANRILDGMVDYIERHPNLRLIELNYPSNNPADLEIEDELDAALIWAGTRNTWYKKLLEKKVPMLNISPGLSHEGIPCISYDGKQLNASAIKHLIDSGCRQVFYASTCLESIPEKGLQRDAFLGEAKNIGVPSGYISISERTDIELDRHLRLSDKEFEHIRDFLSTLDFPVGIHCLTDYVALHISRTALEMGIIVPDQLALTGSPDYRIARCCHPRLSSFPLGHGISQQAMRIIDRHLTAGKNIPMCTSIPPPPIIWRESTGGGHASAAYIQRARRLIHELACSSVTVPEIAARSGATSKTLNLKFREIYGITPGEMLRLERINYAKNYLAETSQTVSDVASLCGYNQQSKFSNFFKRETGMTPMQYRKQYHSEFDSSE